MEISLHLKETVKKLPKKPGVYVFRNSKRKIIYIGKALSLKNRVSSYFHQSASRRTYDPKTVELVLNIVSVQTFLVNSEFEALLLEAKLIKQHKPKYNIAGKDGKSYLYIIIGKKFPNRIYSSRNPEKETDILTWYGPFPSSRDVEEILRFIRGIFPFRSCANLQKRVCLYCDLKLCPGVCVNSKVAPFVTLKERPYDEEYRKIISSIRQLLSGKTTKVIQGLEKEMTGLARKNRFEEAQIIKYRINSLMRLTQNWRRVPRENQLSGKATEEIKNILIKHGSINLIALNKIEGYDVSNLSSQIIVGSMVAFVNAEPEKASYRKFNLKGHFNFQTGDFYNHQNDPEGIKQILSRRLNHPDWILPQLILIDGGKTQISAAFEALKEKNYDIQIALLGLTKGEETLIIPLTKNRVIKSWKSLRLPRNSAALQLLQQIRDESHRFAQKYYKTAHLRTISK